MIKYEVGNGELIHIWFDSWHPQGPLINCFGHSVVCSFGIPLCTKLSAVIENSQWKWPPI